MKRLEYSRFATITIVIAQLLSGLIGIVTIIMGALGLFQDILAGLLATANGIVFLGVFFALARVQAMENPEPFEE